jgi:hypothetical protein
MSGSLKSISRELAKYKLDSVGVQKSNGTRMVLNSRQYTFFYGNWPADYHLGTCFFIHKVISAVKRVEYVSHMATMDKCDDTKTAFMKSYSIYLISSLSTT